MQTLATIGPIGWQELLAIFIVLVFLFGATKLPMLARALGETIRNLRNSLKEPVNDVEETSMRRSTTQKHSS